MLLGGGKVRRIGEVGSCRCERMSERNGWKEGEREEVKSV